VSTCNIEDCNNKHNSYGLCHMHYSRLRVWGDPYFSEKNVEDICKLCERKHRSLGLCNKHYNMYRIWGDPFYNHNEQVILNHLSICTVKRCNNPYYCKGLCKSHSGKKRHIKNHDKINAYTKKYYRSNKERCLNLSREWRRKNPEKRLASDKKYLLKYGKEFNMNSWKYQYAVKSWSKTIREMDNYMCKLCDSTIQLNAHHIYPKLLFPELSLDLSNGVTLCKKCHGEIHGFDIYNPKSNL